MLTGLEALISTNSRCLFHAHGRATDTRDHLRTLQGDDPKARELAIDHMVGGHSSGHTLRRSSALEGQTGSDAGDHCCEYATPLERVQRFEARPPKLNHKG
jgi:hypothetical protein